MKTLPRSFYKPSAEVVAKALLGHWLVHKTAQGICGGVIVETEAYLVGDPASHAFRGQTKRNAVMFGPPGYAYVYFIYGNHFCFNAVCGAEGVSEAVLIRAIEPAFGTEEMQSRRGVADARQVSNGPGKLCAAMGISRDHDGADLCKPGSPLFIAENPDAKELRKTLGPVKTGPRIGISKAAEVELRFYLAGSKFVSRR